MKKYIIRVNFYNKYGDVSFYLYIQGTYSKSDSNILTAIRFTSIEDDAVIVTSAALGPFLDQFIQAFYVDTMSLQFMEI